MAFPTVATVNYSEETADTTTHDVLVPASISAGDLLMLFTAIDGDTVTQPTVTGWTNVMFANGTGGLGLSMGVWYKFASGSETAFTYTSSVSERSSNRTWRVTGAHVSSPPEVTTGGPSGFVASFNFTTVTPTWGSADNLYVVFLATSMDGGASTVNTYPTGFTGNQFEDESGNTGADAGVILASLNETSSTHNPDSVVLSASTSGLGRTLVIRPAEVGGAVTLDPFGMSGFFGA